MTNLTQQDVADLLSMGYRTAAAQGGGAIWVKPFGYSVCVFDPVGGTWYVLLRSIKGETLLWKSIDLPTWKDGDLMGLLAYWERHDFEDHGGTRPENSVPFGFLLDRDRELVYEMTLERNPEKRPRKTKKTISTNLSVHEELMSRGWELWKMGGDSTAYGQVLPGGGYIQLMEVDPSGEWTGNAPSDLDDRVAIYKYFDDDEKPAAVEIFGSLREFLRRRR